MASSAMAVAGSSAVVAPAAVVVRDASMLSSSAAFGSSSAVHFAPVQSVSLRASRTVAAARAQASEVSIGSQSFQVGGELDVDDWIEGLQEGIAFDVFGDMVVEVREGRWIADYGLECLWRR